MNIMKRLDAASRVTLPKEVRSILEVGPDDAVIFSLGADGHVRIESAAKKEYINREKIAAEVLQEYGYAVPEDLRAAIASR